MHLDSLDTETFCFYHSHYRYRSLCSWDDVTEFDINREYSFRDLIKVTLDLRAFSEVCNYGPYDDDRKSSSVGVKKVYCRQMASLDVCVGHDIGC